MSSSSACPSCQHSVPFDSDVCPQCHTPLLQMSQPSIEQSTQAPGLRSVVDESRDFSKERTSDSKGPRVENLIAAAITSTVRQKYDDLRKVLPQVNLSLERFREKIVDVLERYLPQSSLKQSDPNRTEISRILDGLQWQALFLTTACAEGNEAAWQIFKSQFRLVIEKAAVYCSANFSEARELGESLMTDLFLPASAGRSKGGSKIGQYDGIGSLEGWIKVVISRMAIDEIRRHKKQVSLEDLEADPPSLIANPGAGGSPVELVDKKACQMFRASFQFAIGRLTQQQKLVLRLYFAQDVNLKEIGKLLKVHESTASRIINKLKTQLRKDVEKHLRQSFGVKPGEIPHVIATAYSKTEFNLKNLLAE